MFFWAGNGGWGEKCTVRVYTPEEGEKTYTKRCTFGRGESLFYSLILCILISL